MRWALGLLARSWSFEIEGEGEVRRLHAAGIPIVYAVWHGDLLPALWRHRGEPTTLLISHHRDGSRLARLVGAWGYRVVRGSSTRGGAGGLRALVRALASGGDVAITPDGPRGPARVAKPGAVAAAQQAGAALLPVAAAATGAWRARSWDRFLVPRPFARVRIAYGRAFMVAAGTEGRERARTRLQAELARVTDVVTCQR